jgi:hypothetical protein
MRDKEICYSLKKRKPQTIIQMVSTKMIRKWYVIVENVGSSFCGLLSAILSWEVSAVVFLVDEALSNFNFNNYLCLLR